MGMQRHRPPTGAAEVVRELASKGYAQDGIAATFKISKPTLHTWFEKYPTIRQAYEEGREVERQALHGSLYAQALRGNVVAAIFLLKARHQYRENELLPTEGNRVNITFNLPGAMKPEEYTALNKVIDGNATDTTKRLPDATVSRS